MKSVYLVHYAEIGLKGRNRPQFERQLIKNIARQHRVDKARRLRGRIVLETSERLDLGNVFGISWWTRAGEIRAGQEEIYQAAIELARGQEKAVRTFAIRAKVANKRFDLDSQEIERVAGDRVRESLGWRVDLAAPDLILYIEVTLPEAFVYTTRNPGPGGLPVGSAGKALGLFSGGIDSSVAPYLMAKRGAEIELIHFYALPGAEDAHQGKIGALARALCRFIPQLTVHYLPYHEFQLATASLHRSEQRQELVLFRRFMAMAAEKLAARRGALALFTGDSLGQVASQTLENLAAVRPAVSLPIFRPLIAYDKLEIIRLAKHIATYDIAIRSYKDCCSIIAREPATKANMRLIENLETEIDAERIASSAVDSAVSYFYRDER